MTLAVGCEEPKSAEVLAPESRTERGPEVHTVSTGGDVNSGGSVSAVRTAMPKPEIPDFPEDVDFFSSPKAMPVRNELAADASKEQKSIRLIGFINPNPLDDSLKLALLKVGDQLVHLRVGQTFEDVELLSIDDRSVTLQRQRDRWTLAMMDQPVVNRATAPPKPMRRQSTSRGAADNLVKHAVTPQFNEPPLADVWEPPTPKHPRSRKNSESQSFALPDDLEMPELPELPDLEGLPGM